ncbi:MAG: hypothetical protein ACRC68_16620 [Clostridium sp.]
MSIKKAAKQLNEIGIEATESDILKIIDEIGDEPYLISQNGISNYKIIQKFVINKYNEKVKALDTEIIDSLFVKNGVGNVASAPYSYGAIVYYALYLTTETLEVYSLMLSYKEAEHHSYKLKDIVSVETQDNTLLGEIMANNYVIEIKGKRLRLKSIGVSLNKDIEEFINTITELKKA